MKLSKLFVAVAGYAISLQAMASVSAPTISKINFGLTTTPQTVTLTGTGFLSTTTAKLSSITTNLTVATVSSTSLKANLPIGLAPGDYILTAANGTASVAWYVTYGAGGAAGAAASVTVGTTTTGAAGTNASVTNSGTSAAAVLNFTVPQGATGLTGSTGAAGPTGPQGLPGPMGATGSVGPAGPTGATGSAGPTGSQGPKGDTGSAGLQGPAGSGTMLVKDSNGNVVGTFFLGNPTTEIATSHVLIHAGSIVFAVNLDRASIGGNYPANFRKLGFKTEDCTGEAYVVSPSPGWAIPMFPNTVVGGDSLFPYAVVGGDQTVYVGSTHAEAVPIRSYLRLNDPSVGYNPGGCMVDGIAGVSRLVIATLNLSSLGFVPPFAVD